MLKDRISIVKNEIVSDRFGFKEIQEVEYYSCWCSYTFNSSKEKWDNYTKDTIVVSSFKIRRCQKTNNLDTKSYFIKFKNKMYNIIFIDDSNRDYIYIKAEARV